MQAQLDGYQARRGREPNTMQPYLDYVDADGNAVARMWLTTPDALRYRMDRTLPFALGGVAFDDLMSSGLANGVLDAILNYKVQIPAPPQPPDLALRWTIQGVDGVIGQVTTGLNEPLVATIQAPDGNYAINVEVVSGDQAVRRRAAGQRSRSSRRRRRRPRCRLRRRRRRRARPPSRCVRSQRRRAIRRRTGRRRAGRGQHRRRLRVRRSRR